MKGSAGIHLSNVGRTHFFSFSSRSLCVLCVSAVQSVCLGSPMSQAMRVMAETAEEQARHRGATARRLVGEMAPYRARILIGFGFIVVGAAAQAAGPLLIGRAIDQAILRADRAALTRIMLLLLAVYARRGAGNARTGLRRSARSGQHVLASLRARLFARFQRLPLGFFDRRPVGDLMSRVHQRCRHAQPAASRRG